ncbi:Patatin [Rhynchospora pubera]|uniref:Patatin n=1 Tax=Rhynchospora pubera TaxID=906938 RepID=A0AAV8HD48_9POAL|nr:Patatin [Rhynchospora pubera]
MSWGLGWKRPSEIFHLSLDYGDLPLPLPLSVSDPDTPTSDADADPNAFDLGFRISLDWSSADDEETAALRLQSQLVVALPPPQDTVILTLNTSDGQENGEVGNGDGKDEDRVVTVAMDVVKRREPLKAVKVSRPVGSGQQTDGSVVLVRLIRAEKEGVPALVDHWKSVSFLSLCGCGLSAFPVELITQLPQLEKLYLHSNKLTVLPPELGGLKNLKVLSVDNNMLVSVPVELRECVFLEELSLEYNKLIRPLLDFRAMSELRVLRLFGNPLEFLPEILPLKKLRHLSLANIRIEATENLKSVSVEIEDSGSYFLGPKPKLSAFLSLIFRFSSCHHPLLASALAKIMEDHDSRMVISKEENAVRQLISMVSSDNRHVVEQACIALCSLASDKSHAMQLLKCDIMQPIESVLRSNNDEELISVLKVLVVLVFVSDSVAQKLLTKDVLKSLKTLCANKNPEVQRLSLISVGNLSFCPENRRVLTQSESLRDLLLRLTGAPQPHVGKAAARALAIFGENENLRRAVKARPVGRRGIRILSMDGGGMKGLATVQILKQIEEGTGKKIHEMFDLICGTSTGGMLAIALGIKLMTLVQCEEIYKNLGKLVFAEPIPKDEATSWKVALDQLFKSSSQNFRVVVHGSKHSADQFERLLQEMCADEDGDLLIESAVKGIPKVFAVSTLVSTVPAQPFLFRNYQYPIGTFEMPAGTSESPALSTIGMTTNANGAYRRGACIGSCKHKVWEAVRASSAAPYYLDDFSDDVNRWQDGAIVANNPTIFAMREAQLLWPDARIECLVSIGCGSVPPKPRKGGWRYLDTGQVLIESACSVERVEETLDTLMPMLPDIQYFRFNPVDERCGMELDETDPANWQKLEAATEDYIQKNSRAFKNLCEILVPRYQIEDKPPIENSKSQPLSKFKPSSSAGLNEIGPTLGWRRTVLLVEATYNAEAIKNSNHARSLETFCMQNGIRIAIMSRSPVFSKPTSTLPTPISSPLFTGSFPSSPLLYSPECGPQRTNRIDLVPPLSLDGHPTAKYASPPSSPVVSREPGVHVRPLYDKLLNLPHIGVVHLTLQNDSSGSILSWQNDVFVVAEPGESADRFIQSVKTSLSLALQGQKRKEAYNDLSKILCLSDLVAKWPSFQVGGILHRYIGRQTQVMDDNQEIGAFMFRRTVPAVHMTSDDVRCMAGAWRDRIIICSGKYGLASSLVKAFLQSGAKAVITSSAQPPDTESIKIHGVGSIPESAPGVENGKFVIGDDEEEEEEEAKGEELEKDEKELAEPLSPASDWEDSDVDKSVGSHIVSGWDDDEEELSRFLCVLYDNLFREGTKVDLALQSAIRAHPKFKYTCHI